MSLRFATLALPALAIAIAAPPAGANPFGKEAVPSEALGTMRGGFALPGGLDVSIAVQSDTSVNGGLVLRTLFLANQGAPTLAVFGRTDASTPATTNAAASGRGFTIGVQPAALGSPAGLTKLDLQPGGSATVADGTVRLTGNGPGDRVTYSQSGLDVTHLAGQAYGSFAANSLDNVAIDTATTINIDVGGATAFNVGSTMARVDALALDAAARLSR